MYLSLHCFELRGSTRSSKTNLTFILKIANISETKHTASKEYLTFKKYTGNGMVCNLKTLA